MKKPQNSPATDEPAADKDEPSADARQPGVQTEPAEAGGEGDFALPLAKGHVRTHRERDAEEADPVQDRSGEPIVEDEP